MNIYVPANLRKIPLIGQMCKMIQEYAKYYEDSASSFDSYRYYQKLDPVKRFLGMCIQQKETQSDEEYEAIINYISRLFYSVKGTIKVFEYMKRYLQDLDISGDIIYTTGYVEIRFGELALDDEEIFYQSLTEFLKALLYFEDLRLGTDSIRLNITSSIESWVSGDIISYEEFTPSPYYENSTT